MGWNEFKRDQERFSGIKDLPKSSELLPIEVINEKSKKGGKNMNEQNNNPNQYEPDRLDTLLKWLPKLLTPALLFVLILVVIFKPTEYNVALTAPTQTTNPTFSPNIIVNNTIPNLTVDLNLQNITYNATGNYTQGNVTNYYTIYNTTNSTINELINQTIRNQNISQNITEIWANISKIWENITKGVPI